MFPEGSCDTEHWSNYESLGSVWFNFFSRIDNNNNKKCFLKDHVTLNTGVMMLKIQL